MDNKIIQELIKCNCVKVGEFKLRNGDMSKYYFDMKNLVSYPLLLKRIGDLIYWDVILGMGGCDLLCGIPIGSIPICSYISTTYNIPMIMVRPSVKNYGIRDNIVGEYNSTDRCIIIDDVITSGGSIEEVVEVLNGKVNLVGAAVIVDREQGYKCSIPVESLYKRSDFEKHTMGYSYIDTSNDVFEIKIRKPNDFHHHLRDGETLKTSVEHCFRNFKNVVVMPNLVPPITTIEQALLYRNRIKEQDNYNGNPMMTLYLHKDIQTHDLLAFKNHKEMIGIKLYPQNVTTNSKEGVVNIEEFNHIFKIMEQEDIPLMIHGEAMNVDIFKKEAVFIESTLPKIIESFPKFRIVLEHISTKEAVDFVLNNNVHATITPQHLIMDRNDIFKGGINPHHYCLPILKKHEDKKALQEAAFSGNPKFFLGTDNAPHSEESKLSCCGCAGIFNSPVAVQIIAELFHNNGYDDNLEKFVSTNGCDFYGLPYNEEYITLTEEPWTVPEKYGKFVSLMTGKNIRFSYKNS
jgi:dihydroorotase